MMLFIGAGNGVHAVELAIEDGRQMAGLWVFPSLSQPGNWRYVPAEAVLSNDANGDPAFSMILFVNNAVAADEPEDVAASRSFDTIVEADGGASVHLLVEYRTDAEQVATAEIALREDLGDDSIQLVGPVLFDNGSFSVVTSIVDSNDERNPVLLDNQIAPVLEGNRVPVSLQLSPEEAAMLLGSLNTSTPDLSMVFDMQFTGLSHAYDATVVVDWEKTSRSLNASAGGSLYYVSLDAERAIEELFQDGAIRLEAAGSDERMEALVDRTHHRVLEMLFAPIEIDEEPEDNGGDLLGMLSSLTDPDGGLLSSRQLTGFGAFGKFRLKDMRSEGESRLSFAKKTPMTQHALLTVNIGSRIHEYLDDERFVRTVTPDLAFTRRRIPVSVDGALAPDIGNLVNSIQVMLRKQSSDGQITLDELVIDRSALAGGTVFGPLEYGNLARDAQEGWLAYDYRTLWSFRGGGTYDSGWKATDAAMINLAAPYHYTSVNIEGELEPLRDAGVRAVIAEIEFDFFGRTRTVRRQIRPDAEVASSIEPISLTLPDGSYDYEYRLTWILPDNRQTRRSGHDELGFVFIDEMPPDTSNADGTTNDTTNDTPTDNE